MRRFVLVQLLAAMLCAPTSAAVLRGTVKDTSGRPIAGARIDISTAAPKRGPSLFCPSCYVDCAKSTKSDDQGRFELKSLDDSLKFRLVATAPGKKTALTDLIDPSQTAASITLADFPSDSPPNRVLQGTVLSMEGAPISGALVEPCGAKTSDRRWRGDVGADFAVTDDQGAFRTQLTEDYLGVDLEVTAFGYAGTITGLLTPGESSHTIKVPPGTTVRGRVTFMDAPVAGRPVAVCQVNRGRDDVVFIKAVLATTAADGSFQFQALPADEPYAIFSAVGLGVAGPVLKTTLFSAGKDNATRDLGTLTLVSGLTLEGEIRMSREDDTLPSDLHMTLGRMPAWDLIEVPIDAEGRFRIENLPPETYEIGIRTEEAVLDDSQLNCQVLGTHSFGVRLTGSLTDLVIPLRALEPGETVGRSPPSRTSSSMPGKQELWGRVVDPGGRPVAGIHIAPYLVRGGLPYRHGPRSTVRSRSDGSFRLSDLPDEPIELMFYRPGAFGYPVGKSGKLTLYPGRVRPRLNQSDVRIVFDPTLTEEPPDLH